MVQTNWIVSPDKFLSLKDARILLETAKAVQQRKVSVRDYFIIDLAMSTGLRVGEIAALKISELYLSGNVPSLYVRCGKGGKARLVRFSKAFQKHCISYIKWKHAIREPTGPDAPLIYSSNTKTHITVRAIEKVFKRTAKRAGLPPHYSIHCLRHTYACHLYVSSGYNLRLVQKQLGHSKSRTTEVYADVMMPDLKKALEKLYNQEKSDE